MCNNYRTDKANAAIRDALDLAREVHDRERWSETGRNMPPPFVMYPNTAGRIVHLTPDGTLDIAEGLWGMPSPAKALVTATGKPMSYDPGVTNIRNTSSPHWRRWLGTQNRCLVPVTTFCEPDQVGNPSDDVWFGLADGRELFWFAGVHEQHSRQVKGRDPALTEGEFYAFLTTEPNAEVGAVHKKAMPVILTTAEECEAWLTQPWEDARALQRPLPDGTLKVVKRENRAEARAAAKAEKEAKGSLL